MNSLATEETVQDAQKAPMPLHGTACQKTSKSLVIVAKQEVIT